MGKLSCPKCDSKNLLLTPNKKQPSSTDLYCGDCGRWIKFANKEDKRLYPYKKED